MMKNRWLLLARAGMIRTNQPPGDAGTPPVPTPPPSAPPAPPESRTFDQDAVSAIATREHDRGAREGKRQAEEALLQRLGVTSVDDLDNVAALAKAAKEADDKNKTQAQKDAEEAAALRAEAETDRAAAKAERHSATLERLLTAAGMAPETQAYVTVPGLDVGATVEEIQEKVTAMKEAQPNLFGTAPAPTPPPNADPRPPVTGRTPQGEFGSEGSRRFAGQMARETPPAVT